MGNAYPIVVLVRGLQSRQRRNLCLTNETSSR